MNKQELLVELTEFINSDQVEETDGDVDLGKVSAQLEEFVDNLDDSDADGGDAADAAAVDEALDEKSE